MKKFLFGNDDRMRLIDYDNHRILDLEEEDDEHIISEVKLRRDQQLRFEGQ